MPGKCLSGQQWSILNLMTLRVIQFIWHVLDGFTSIHYDAIIDQDQPYCMCIALLKNKPMHCVNLHCWSWTLCLHNLNLVLFTARPRLRSWPRGKINVFTGWYRDHEKDLIQLQSLKSRPRLLQNKLGRSWFSRPWSRGNKTEFRNQDSTVPQFCQAGCIAVSTSIQATYKRTSTSPSDLHFSVWPSSAWTHFPITKFLRRGTWPMPTGHWSSLEHCLPIYPLRVYNSLRFDMHPLTRSGNASWGGGLLCHVICQYILML